MHTDVISSRTPEGQPGRCPICHASFRIEPSQPCGDAPCPCCGHLIFFVGRAGEHRLLARGRAIRPTVRLVAELGQLVGRAAERVGREVRATVRRVARRPSRPQAPASNALWDPWVDG
jgi:hypothetical protein